ncbi:MAG: hypothetical protein J7L96_01305 [Bacteroidales bacterium]|nr:hypothetical protein [Bacteroidales bacterium]
MAIMAIALLVAACEFILPNKPPFAEMTSPEGELVFTLGATIPVVVNAYDKDGVVTEIQFYLNDVLVETDIEEPYGFSWLTTNYGPGDFMLKVITIDNDNEPYILSFPFSILGNISADAGADVTVRSNVLSYTLEASPPAYGTGTWEVIQGEGGSFSDINAPDAIFTGQACTSYTLRWTVSQGSVSKTDDVSITFYHTPTDANAGEDQSFTDGTLQTNLQANTPLEGFGRWNIVSGGNGRFENNLDPITLFTGEACTDYVLSWTVQTSCAKSVDEVEIHFKQVIVGANAGTDQHYYDGSTSTTLHGNSPGTNTASWSIVSGTGGGFSDPTNPEATFSGQVCETYELRWSVESGCGTSTDEVIVEFGHIPSDAIAGDDQSYSDGRVTTILNANAPTQGDGEWTFVSGAGGAFDDASDPKSKFTGSLCETYVLKWTISTTCASTEDEVSVTFGSTPTTAFAGDDVLVTSGATPVVLDANTPLQGTGTWVVISGDNNSTFSDIHDPQASFTGNLCMSYVLEWKIETQCASSADQVVVTFDQVTIPASAGPDQSFFDGTIVTTLNANDPQPSIGTWTIVSGTGGVLSDVNDHFAAFTGVLGEVYTLRWSVGSSCGYSSDLTHVAYLQTGTFTDDRDGTVYPTVTIGNLVWMTKNLNYKTVNGSYAFSGEESIRDIYGLLYTFDAAIQACPAGYHLPTDAEWRSFEESLGLSHEAALLTGYRGYEEGGMMKELGATHWHAPNAGGSNLVGYEALPGGYRDKNGNYALLGGMAAFWTGTGDDEGVKALYRALSKDKSQIGRDWFDMGSAISVRCVKD